MKNRHTKLFSEKFIINSDKITSTDETNLFETITKLIENYTISANQSLKVFLQENGLYNGSFYLNIHGNDFLGFNLEYRSKLPYTKVYRFLNLPL